MRYYVRCHDNHEEKIYLKLEGEPTSRSSIPFEYFSVTCQTTGARSPYSASEIQAEPGAALPITGTAVGALLFIFAPLAGAIGALAGFAGATEKERQRVEAFNRS